MKVVIKKPDGTTIELDGTPEEVGKVMGPSVVHVHEYVPYRPHWVEPLPYPTWKPLWCDSPGITFTTTTGNTLEVPDGRPG